MNNKNNQPFMCPCGDNHDNDPALRSQHQVAMMLAQAWEYKFIQDGMPTIYADSQHWETLEQIRMELFKKAVERVVGKLPPPPPLEPTQVVTDDVPFKFEDEAQEYKEKLDYYKD